MPFFSRSTEEEPVVEEPVVHEEPKKHHGLFGSRNRSPSPTPTASTRSSRNTATTYRTSPSNAGGSALGSKRGSLLHRSFGNGNSNVELDPSIVQARESLMGAEAAEREADRALEMARQRVRDARDHVRRLEVEAKEEARRAKIKAYHAREVSKRGKQLGRHDL